MNMTSLTQTIVSLLAAHPERPVLVALDGRCGSGKTTLAAQLAEQFPGSAVSIPTTTIFPRHSASRTGPKRPAPIWT